MPLVIAGLIIIYLESARSIYFTYGAEFVIWYDLKVL